MANLPNSITDAKIAASTNAETARAQAAEQANSDADALRQSGQDTRDTAQDATIASINTAANAANTKATQAAADAAAALSRANTALNRPFAQGSIQTPLLAIAATQTVVVPLDMPMADTNFTVRWRPTGVQVIPNLNITETVTARTTASVTLVFSTTGVAVTTTATLLVNAYK